MENESNNFDEQQLNNWNQCESNNWESNNWESNHWESTNWEPNHLEPTNWEPNHLEPTNWEPNHLESTNLEPNHLEPNHLESTNLEPNHLEPTNLEPNHWESNNWESNNWEANNWEANNWESNNWESNEEEPNNWEQNEEEPNSWEPNEEEPNNWKPNEEEPNNWKPNEEESNNHEAENWHKSYTWDEEKSNNWNEEEPNYNGWDEDEPNYNEWDGTFNNIYCCYPLSTIDKSNLESGGKIIMPPSALSLLVCLEIEYPMLFELKNLSTKKVTYCGVQEFIADEGNIYMPKLMMENMHLEEGSKVNVRSIQIPRGIYVKLQPHTKDFLEISNLKAILEFSLRNYFCLTTGDTIMITFNNRQYYMNIVETKPSNAVSIVETDCEVDFVKPLDHEEKPEKELTVSSNKDTVHDDSIRKSDKMIPFTGIGRRLDGKSCTPSVEEVKTSSSSPTTFGKLVFGSNVNASKIQTSSRVSKKSTTKESSQKQEDPKFQPFTGKKYSLKTDV